MAIYDSVKSWGGNHPDATYQLWWFINRLKVSFCYYWLPRF